MDAAPQDSVKVKSIRQGGGARLYRDLCYGRTSLGHVLLAETLITLVGGLPGACGYFLRGKLYPCLFGTTGGRLLIGRNVSLRHPRKIRLGRNVIIDDNVMLDAKGTDNEGIVIGDNVFVGRNTIVYCKNGNVRIEDGASLSSNCVVFSSNALRIGAGTVIGAYSYLLSGGEYDPADPTPFAEQSGMRTAGPLTLGRDCWLGARVTVLDAACIGDRCVIGAGAVVTRPVPDRTLAVGTPARAVKSI